MMKNKKILFVDDEDAGRKVARFNLQEKGYEVEEAASAEQALKIFSPETYQLIITDIRMPGLSGIELLKEIKKHSPDTPVLVITAYAKIDSAIEAMKLGAFDFIIKPFSKDQLLLAVEKAFEHKKLKDENLSLKLQARGIKRKIVHRSKKMRELLTLVDRVANSDAAVFITGESGTGKELIARRIHCKSQRAKGPFVPINCAALPTDLLESELFGYAEGAFTGAIKEKLGYFRQANTGTIFFDEISEIPEALQGKLLRAIQEQVIDVLGEDKSTEIDVRIISATNKNIETLIKEGKFREDLFFRLNVVSLNIPPLRERSEDIKTLVKHFLRVFAEHRDLSIPSELLKTLEKYSWPGNVRELENTCQRLVLLCNQSTLSTQHLPPGFTTKANNQITATQEEKLFELPEDGLSLVDLEKNIILRVLELKNWNISKSASYLGVPRHILAYRMEKYGITRTR